MNAVANMGTKAMMLAVGGYLVGINAFSVGLFWYDKHQAQMKAWRVPEKSLQFTALLGGWIGGMWAMEKFRHKTQKQEFRGPYFLATGANCVLMAGGGYYLMNKGPVQVQQVLSDFANSPTGRTILREGKKIIYKGGRR